MNRIGRYEIAEKLGEGGMGTVYKAWDPLLTRVVAVKIISNQLDSQPEQRERFFREARAAAQLSHRNIITIYDLGEQDGRPFLAMEYLVGRDLDARMHAPETMSLARKLEIALAICEGLAHAHAFGVVHRDIKPANVFLTSDGGVKILDFGLARLITSELTRSNMMLGTLNYMAPEQLRAEKSDHRADIFSLGVVLYELFSGKKPFQGDSFASTMYKILQETPEPLDRIDPTLSPQLTATVDRALAKAREDRYQQVLDLLRDLEAAYEPMRGSDRRIIEHVEALLRPAEPSARTPSRPFTGPDEVTMSDATIAADYAPAPSRTPLPATPPPATRPLATPPPATRPPSATSPGSGGPPLQAPPSRRLAYIAIGLIGLAVAAVLLLRGLGGTDGPTTAGVAGEAPPAVSEPAPAPQASPEPAPPPPRVEVQEPATPPPPAPAEPEPAEPREAEASAQRARVARIMRQARAAFDARRYDEASRAASNVLALDQSHVEARALLQRIETIERQHAAESLSAMEAAKEAASRAEAADLVPHLYSAAEKQESEARAANAGRQFTAAAARFDAATSLFRSAESAARREAELRATREREAREADEQRRRAEADEARRRAEAAAPPPAPAPEKPEPPARTGPPPEEVIAAVVGRYSRALEDRDISALRAVWPGLGGAQQAAIESEFANARSITVAFVNPRIEVAGTSATVTGRRRYSLETRDGQQLRSETVTTLVLRQAGGGWVIESVRHEPVR